MDQIWNDLRSSLRSLRQSPLFTVMVVLTLAFGIGVNVAIFSIVDGLVLESLPYAEPDRLMHLWEAKPDRGWTDVSISAANFFDWQERNRVFESLVLYSRDSINLSGAGEPERLSGVHALANVFALTGVKPLLGRDFDPDEGGPGSSPVAVISHGLWQRRFGSEPEVVGKELVLNGRSHSLIGVMPEGFFFPEPGTDVWIPSDFTEERQHRGHRGFAAVGRLRGGVSLEQARLTMNELAGELAREFPEENAGWGITVLPVLDEMLGEETFRVFAILMLAVGFVLLIACTNVANLLLSRSVVREREVALRVALGASRLRLLRQMLSESLLLALVGGGLGMLVAQSAIRLLVSIAPAEAPRLENVDLDGSVLLYSLGLTLASALLFGLVPALQASAPRLGEALKEGGRRSSGAPRHRLLRGLVVAEVALAIVLLVLGVLMIRSFQTLVLRSPGFDVEPLLTLRVTLPQPDYPEPEARVAFFGRLLDELNGLPQVESASAVQTLPLSGSNSWRAFSIEGRPIPDPDDRQSVGYLAISGDYFESLAVPLLRGRTFAEADEHPDAAVAIINRTMAKQYWPDAEPIGQRLRFGHSETEEADWLRIVGVVADVRHSGLDDPPRPEVYVPHHESSQGSMSLVLRSSGEPGTLVEPVRLAVWSIDPNLPVYDVRTMSDLLAEDTSGPRLAAQILGTLAIGALLLAAVGIYGVVSFAVGQRTYELGVRRAIGARQGELLALAMRQGLVPVAVGLVLGLVLGAGLAQALRGLLHGVTPADPASFVLVVLLLGSVAGLAVLRPALRASRVDPVTVLRAE